MKRRYGSKRRARKPAYKKRRSINRKRVRRVKKALGLSKSLPGFPQGRIVKMRYADQFLAAPTTPNYWSNTFRANSIFDPDFTNVGHQPLGHDQWSNFYNHYIVIGSMIKVKVIRSIGADTAAPSSYVTLQLHDTSSFIQPGTDYNRMLENGLIKWRLITPSWSTSSISMGYSPKRFFNIKDVKDNVTRIGAAFGQNPTEDVYWTVTYNPLDTLATAAPVRVIVTIDYIVLMSEPKDLAIS